MTYYVGEDGMDDPDGKSAYYIGVGGAWLANTCLAAATWMLENDLEMFFKKERDDGTWWVLLYQHGDRESRVRGEGDNLALALIDAFERMGLGGIRWKLHALERRIVLLSVMFGQPEPPKRKKERACPHGVSGGRCKQCV